MNTGAPSQDTTSIIYMAIIIIAVWAFSGIFSIPKSPRCFRLISYGELWLLSRIVARSGHPAGARHDARYAAITRSIGLISAIAPGSWSAITSNTRSPSSLLCWAIICWSPRRKPPYKKAYTLDRLIAAQVKIWPVIAPIVRILIPPKTTRAIPMARCRTSCRFLPNRWGRKNG